MKSIKWLLIFLIVGLSTNAQNNNKRIYVGDNPDIILILNEEIVGSIDLLKAIPSDQVQKLTIHKDGKLSSKENLYFNNNEGGIMNVKTDFTVETKNQKELNDFFGLDPDTNVYVNGFLLENKNYKIASKSINKIEIVERDIQFLKKRILNISIE